MCLCLNLLNSGKEQEQNLTLEYEKYVWESKEELGFIKYEYFDYHSSFKMHKNEEINKTVNRLK
jgi:hypothetical protein